MNALSATSWILIGMAIPVFSEPVPAISVQSPLPWLHITSSASPLFRSTIDEVLGSNLPPIVTSILPYSVVITNASAYPLSAIDVRFSLDASGRPVVKNFFYHSFGAPQSPILKAGQSRVFTPLKDANAMLWALEANQAAGGAGARVDPSTIANLDAIGDLASAQSIQVSIDLAIAPDGRFAGDDRAGTIKKLNQTMQAYREMREQLLVRLNQGTPDLSLETWLVQISKQPLMRDSETNAADRHIAMQLQLANEWLGYIRAGKRSDLDARVSSATPEKLFPYITSLRGGLQ